MFRDGKAYLLVLMSNKKHSKHIGTNPHVTHHDDVHIVSKHGRTLRDLDGSFLVDRDVVGQTFMEKKEYHICEYERLVCSLVKKYDSDLINIR